MSGLPRNVPGVWQSEQPASVTRYLPRWICESSARATSGRRSSRRAQWKKRKRDSCIPQGRGLAAAARG